MEKKKCKIINLLSTYLDKCDAGALETFEKLGLVGVVARGGGAPHEGEGGVTGRRR